ncbi:MAG: acyltransferase [Candidatus Nanopelagicales bacterium]
MTEQGSIAPDVRIATNAEVDRRASIGPGSAIWGLACVREHAVLGRDCIVGRGAYIEDGVVLGDRVKVQTNALLFKPAQIGDDVFIGPAVVLTNDRYPRSSTPDGNLKRDDDWTAEGVVIEHGASIGARSLILPGVHVGRYAMVAAGAVVTRDVPDYALVVGTPARRAGWAGPAGRPLETIGDGRWVCPATGHEFVEASGRLTIA